MKQPVNLLTQGRKALMKRLETINVDNGYLTSAGTNVRTGWFNEVLKSTGVAFPLIVLQKGRGKTPERGPGALKVFNGFYVVGAVDAGLDEYEEAIEALEQDLLIALVPTEGQRLTWVPRGITGVTVGTPETFPPSNGERAASVLIPVQLHTIIQG